MNFIKTTFLGGLLVLFPLLLFYLAVIEIAQVLVALAEPIAEMFPRGYFDHAYFPGVVAAILLTFAAFFCGLLAKSQVVKNLGASFERAVLDKMPMYTMLKSLSAAFLNAKSTAFTPALLDGGDGTFDPCYVVETHSNDLATVLIPWSPTSFAGSVKIVRIDSIRKLNCSLDAYSRSLSLMGVGFSDCIKR